MELYSFSPSIYWANDDAGRSYFPTILLFRQKLLWFWKLSAVSIKFYETCDIPLFEELKLVSCLFARKDLFELLSMFVTSIEFYYFYYSDVNNFVALISGVIYWNAALSLLNFTSTYGFKLVNSWVFIRDMTLWFF